MSIAFTAVIYVGVDDMASCRVMSTAGNTSCVK